MHPAPRSVVLPTGLWAGGRHQRVAVLLPPTGRVEAAIADAAGLGDLERSGLLLRACVAALGTLVPPEPSVLDALPLGDREALLLHLQAITFGERLDAVARCPDCGNLLDLDLAVPQLLLEPDAGPYADPARRLSIEHDGAALAFRLPAAADLLAVAGLEPARAEAALVQRCLGSALPGDATPDPDMVAAVAAAMSAQDPQAEILLELHCPECGAAFGSALDTGTYLLREIDQHAAWLFAQVHTLALAYHWSEADILDLPHDRRMMYLALLDDAVAAVAP